MSVQILVGDCRELLRGLPDASVDSVVTDPPYELGFMGKAWDRSGIAYDVGMWREVLRVLKPGGHLLAFGGTRTYHRVACAIEDAGFEIRDKIDYYRCADPEREAFLASLTSEQQEAFLEAFGRPSMLSWAYGSGFPKSLDVSKAIDKAESAQGTYGAPKSAAHAGWVERGRMRGENGHEGLQRPWMDDAEAVDRNARQYLAGSDAARQWAGWGTALKPAHEPIVCARKPLKGTVAQNVLAHGTGALNIDGCRVPGEKPDTTRGAGGKNGRYGPLGAQGRIVDDGLGRWPANLIHDGSDEVLACFPDAPGQQADISTAAPSPKTNRVYGAMKREGEASQERRYAEEGGTNFAMRPGARRLGESSAARFFMQCKGDPFDFWRGLHLLCEPANTAESDSSRTRRSVVSALVRAANSALPEGLCCASLCLEPSTSATESELSRLAENVTQAIQSIGPRFWLASEQQKLSLSLNPVRVAAIREPTGTITITASHWKSDGSAEPATFSITPLNSAPGARDSGGPSRLIYCAKPNAAERHIGLEDPGPQFSAGSTLRDAEKVQANRRGNHHPTIKPLALMQYLVRLVTPPGGTVLDPFAGSGTTGLAADCEGFNAILCELNPEYAELARRRITGDAPLFAEVVAA